ncbi:hypothetical protein U1Q18_052506 [Sarracenia purpurea var. burkii]
MWTFKIASTHAKKIGNSLIRKFVGFSEKIGLEVNVRVLRCSFEIRIEQTGQLGKYSFGLVGHIRCPSNSRKQPQNMWKEGIYELKIKGFTENRIQSLQMVLVEILGLSVLEEIIASISCGLSHNLFSFSFLTPCSPRHDAMWVYGEKKLGFWREREIRVSE